MACNGTTFSSCVASTLGASASSTPWPMAQGLLESSIPGFSIFSALARTYFRLDLSAIVSALLPIAALIAGLRYAYGQIYHYVMEYGISTAEIKNDDQMYNYLMYWISQQRFVAKNKSFVAGTKTSSDLVYDYYDDDDNELKNEDEIDWELAEENFDKFWAQSTQRGKIKTIYYTPREGTHYFRYQGRFFIFTRHVNETGFGRLIDKQESLFISSLGRDATVLKDLLKEAQKMYIDRDSTKTVIFRKSGDGNNWQRCMARPPRPISTVVLDSKQKTAIVNDIREYLHPLTKRWYANRGIPYRRGYLLHGPPGTGKTSLCVAIAGLFGLDVHVLSLNSRSLTEDGLAQLFSECDDRCCILLEDVDSAGITHKRAEDVSPPADKKDKVEEALEAAGAKTGTDTNLSTSGISLSGLLNIIDGVASSEGRILIMTTNHVEKLDPALLRPGRVDMSVAFENATTATAKELFTSTYLSREEDYPTTSNGSAVDTKRIFRRKFDFSDDEIANLATQFAVQIPSGEFSPAAIQGHLLKNKSTPQLAVDTVPEWMQKTREDKERQKSPDSGSTKQSETPVLVEAEK